MNLTSLAKKASERKAFTAKLPDEMAGIKKRHLLESIVRRESAYSKQRDFSKAYKAINDSTSLSSDQKTKITNIISQDSGGMGRVLAAGIAAVGAPLLLGSISEKVPGYIKGFSVPIAALGGATLFDLLSKPKTTYNYSKAYPMISDNSIKRWTGA